MSAHVIPEGPGTPKRQKFPFLRGSLEFGAREPKTGVINNLNNYLMRRYVVIKVWKYASPSIEEFFDTLEDAQQYATILNRQQQFVEAETHFAVFQAVQG